jgi:hypothetical protein
MLMIKRSLVAVSLALLSPAVFAQGAQMVFQNFDGPNYPKNKEGVQYPSAYSSSSEGGSQTLVLDSSKKVAGASALKVTLNSGNELYIQWNPWDGVSREFARTYVANPGGWTFNTYNRFKMWFWVPTNATPERRDGRQNFYLGTYVKRVTNYARNSDEEGGGHFYHPFNVVRGQWNLCVFNAHPGHERGQNGGVDSGTVLYPTSGDPARTYNYFDALTRFYIQENERIANFPRSYWLDEMSFYQETRAENDDQVYSICAAANPSSNSLFLSWNRPKSENSVKHEVRYSFTDIHSIGWAAATPAPNGTVTPPGWEGYNGMVYETSGINMNGGSTLYLAIKPQNSNTFSQIAVPLTSSGTPTTPTPPATVPNPPSQVTAR